MTRTDNRIFIRLSKHNLDGDSSLITDDIKIFEIDLTDDDKLSYTDVTDKPFRYNKYNRIAWFTRNEEQSPKYIPPNTIEPFTSILINELKSKKPEIAKNSQQIIKAALEQIIDHILSISKLTSDELSLCRDYLILITDSSSNNNKILFQNKFNQPIKDKIKRETNEEYKEKLNSISIKITKPKNNENYNYMDFLNDNQVLKKDNMIVRLFRSELYKYYDDIIVKIIDDKLYIFFLKDLYPSIKLKHTYDKSQDKLILSNNGEAITDENAYDILVSDITKDDITKDDIKKNINDKKFEYIASSNEPFGRYTQDKQEYIEYIIIL